MVIIGHYELVSGVAKMLDGNGEGLNLSLLGVQTSFSFGNLMRHLYPTRPTFGFLGLNLRIF